MKTEVIDFKLYGKCLKMSNDIVEAILTLDVGPRIIGFSFVGGNNVFHSDRDEFEPMGGKEFDEHYYEGAVWENFGGHRLWCSPESLPETYNPDDKPVKYEIVGNTVILTQEPQTANGIANQIEVTMPDGVAQIKVNHKMKNIGDKTRDFAIWALTVMAKGGIEIIPQNTRDTGLLGNRLITVWPYADVRDERLFMGNKYVTLCQNPKNTNAFKMGFDCEAGCGYYVLGDTVFKKEYNHVVGGNYPDGGVSYETYTNETILEFETLGELKTVKPGETSEHEETFTLYKKPFDFDETNEAEIEKFITALK